MKRSICLLVLGGYLLAGGGVAVAELCNTR